MIRIILLVGFLGLLGNLLVLNYFVFQHQSKLDDFTTRISMLAESVKTARNRVVGSFEAEPSEKSTCDAECVAIINAAVDEKVAKIKIPTQVAKPVAVATGVKTREWVIPLGPGTVDVINTWFDAYTAQAIINTVDYPPIQQAYFEVVMHIPNGTGQMSARLYDTSTPYLFSGQVLNTTSGTGQLLSVPFPIQSGSKSYHVQLYSTISQGVLDSSRIRLVTQ